jgi:hypothetical protein
MSLFTITLIIWSIATAVLVVLLIYRSTLTIHEDDQLFLDESEAHFEQEQKEILNKFAKVNPMIRLFGSASGVLILVMSGLWIYESLTTIQ